MWWEKEKSKANTTEYLPRTLQLNSQIPTNNFQSGKAHKNEQAHKDIVHCEQGPINTNKWRFTNI